MTKELLCFADDTTGALDVAGSFHSRGNSTEVCLEGNFHKSLEATCVVHNLNTRYKSPEESKVSLEAVLGQMDKDVLASSNLFLKVDSTLRGNILNDIDTINNILPGRPVFFAPAFPFYGRTCLEGVYSVKGKPILDTEFAKDQAFQHMTSSLSDNRGDIQHIDWRTLSKGPDVVASKINNSGMNKFTFDTRDQTDLAVIAHAGLLLDAVLVGSSGLARALPKEQFLSNNSFVVDNIPTLFVIGSIHQMSRMQKVQLVNAGVIGVDIHQEQIGAIGKLHAIKERIQEELYHGLTVFISTPNKSVSDQGLWREMEDSMSEATSVTDISHNLVIVGGETARAILKGRQINRLSVRAEYEAGIPISSERNRSEAIFTKAGGFGHSNTLVDIYRLLQK